MERKTAWQEQGLCGLAIQATIPFEYFNELVAKARSGDEFLSKIFVVCGTKKKPEYLPLNNQRIALFKDREEDK